MPNYDEYAKDFAPQIGPRYPDLSQLADGDYDFTILVANEKETKKTGDDLIELECLCEQTGQIVPNTYFMNGQEGVDRFGGDMSSLGFPSDTWPAIGLNKAIPACVRSLPGKRFKGTKKTVQGKGKNAGKTYHNLYLNSALPDAPPQTLQEALATQEKHAPKERFPSQKKDDTVPF